MIKIWNYSKTVNRGVREISVSFFVKHFLKQNRLNACCFFLQLLVDDLLVWTGILDKVNENSLKQQLTFNTILFSNEQILTDHEKQTIVEFVLVFLVIFVSMFSGFDLETNHRVNIRRMTLPIVTKPLISVSLRSKSDVLIVFYSSSSSSETTNYICTSKRSKIISKAK